MELGPDVPAWLTWLAAAGSTALAATVLARWLEAVLDLDPS